MQTFFNPTTPFFDGEGHLLVGAAVSFLDTGTSGSLITIKDSDGVTLPNPLYTGSDGRMRLDNGNGAPAVPCIADGLSYKVAVARRTGVEPVYVGGILQNAAELYEEPYIVFVVTAMGNAEGEDLNTTCVGSIAEVRLVDKAIGTVVCSGYYSAGDCPARVFKWVDSVNPPADNAINVLRNPDDASGYWKMSEPEGGLWDVRMAGCMTSNTPAVNDQCLTRLVNVIDASSGNSKVATVYFPAGNWLLESGYTFGSLVLEAGANLKPADNTADRTLTVGHLENRGGFFHAYGNNASNKRVVLVTGGVLRTSWFKGTLNEFLTDAAIAAPEEIVFDSIDREGSADITISKKVIRVYDGVTYNTNKIKDSGCFVLRYSNGSLHATSYSITNPNAGVTLDLAGLRIGDSASNVEVDHAGVVAKNSDESYVMNLDFEKMEFVNGQHAGSFDASEIHFVSGGGGGSSQESTLDDSTLSFSTSHNGSAEYGVDHFSIHAEDVFDATIDENGFKFSMDYSGTTRYIGFDGRNIDSYSVIGVNKGFRNLWVVTEIRQSGASTNITDGVFADEDQIVVNIVHEGYNASIVSDVLATPTQGRVVKVVYTCESSNMSSVTSFDVCMLKLTYNGNILTYLQFGGSVTLVANGSGWHIDHQRI